MNEKLDMLQKCYEQYAKQLHSIGKKTSIFAGMFGSSKDPRCNLCHDQFYTEVGDLSEQILMSMPDSDSAFDVVKFILGAALEYQNSDGYWYMIAAHGYAKKFIPLLDEDKRAVLAEWYRKIYPKRARVPIQDDIYRMLFN